MLKSDIKKYRAYGHVCFDKTWDSGCPGFLPCFASRGVAYLWLAYILCLPLEWAHFKKIDDLEYFQIVFAWCSDNTMQRYAPYPRKVRCAKLLTDSCQWLIKRGDRFEEEAIALKDLIVNYNYKISRMSVEERRSYAKESDPEYIRIVEQLG